MNNPIPYIDRYFNGELMPAEKRTFESLCLSDPTFAREVAIYVSLQDHLKEQWAEQKKLEFAELEEVDSATELTGFDMNDEFYANAYFQKTDKKPSFLKKNTDNVISKNHQENEEVSSLVPLQEKASKDERGKVVSIRMWSKLAVAATVSGIIALSIIWYTQKNKNDSTVVINGKKPISINKSHIPDTTTATKIIIDTIAKRAVKKNDTPVTGPDKQAQQQLFAKNFKPDITPKETQGILEEAFDHYKNGNYKSASREYKDAIELVESLETRMPEDNKSEEEKSRLLFYAHYYHALSNMAEGKADIAISELKAIKQSPDKFWQNKLQWYLALAYLKSGQSEKAVLLLKQVADSKQAGEYQQKAIALSNELADKSIN